MPEEIRNFKEGLDRLLKMEEMAVRNYQQVAEMAPNPWLAWQVEMIRRHQMQDAWTLTVMRRVVD